MDEGVDPQNMCHHLYGAMGIFEELSSGASSELVLLFEEWLEAVKEEIERLLEAEPNLGYGELASRLGMPEEGVKFLMNRGG